MNGRAVFNFLIRNYRWAQYCVVLAVLLVTLDHCYTAQHYNMKGKEFNEYFYFTERRIWDSRRSWIGN